METPKNVLAVVDTITTLSMLDEFVASTRVETRYVEFRGILPSDDRDSYDREVRRFLKTASAFANTDGGVIFYGVQEKKEGGYSVGGLRDFSFDAATRQLGQILLTSTDPPLVTTRPKELTFPDRASVLVYRILRSWNRPHGVVERGDKASWRSYWLRGDGFNFGMSTDQLGEAFLELDRWQLDADRFRQGRISDLVSHRTYPPYTSLKPALMAHFVPLGRRRHLIDFASLAVDVRRHFGVPGTAGSEDRANTDGWLAFAPLDYGRGKWVQCFRDGTVEFACGLRKWAYSIIDGSVPPTNGGEMELAVVEFAQQAVRWFQACQIEPPFAFYLSILGATGEDIQDRKRYFAADRGRIERETAVLPAVTLPTAPSDDGSELAVALRPALHMMWQTAGWKGSPYFNAEGVWEQSL